MTANDPMIFVRRRVQRLHDEIVRYHGEEFWDEIVSKLMTMSPEEIKAEIERLKKQERP